MDVVCEVCGAVGFKRLLVQCNNCKDSTRHRYCMDTVVYDGPSIEWLCDDCLPKCNKPVESFEAFSNPRERNHIQLYPSMNSMEDLDLSKENDCCFPPSINGHEQSHPSVIDSRPTIRSEEEVDGSSSTLDRSKQSHTLEAIPPSINIPKGIQGSESVSNYSQPVQGSYQNIGSDPLNASIVFLDSRSISKAVDPSCFSNGQGGSTIEKDDPDRTKCVLDKELIAPAFDDNFKGSNLSVAKDCLVSNADNSDEINISDKHLLGAKDNREQGQSKVTSHQNIWRSEFTCSVLNERSNSWKINENSNSKSALMGNQQESNCQGSAEVLHGILNNKYVNNNRQAKKQKSIKVNDARNAFLGDPNAGCSQNDTTQLASQDVVAGDHCSVCSMPVMSAPTDQQRYITTQPIDKPCWTGLMKIGPEYISLAAHLSNKACKKVQELSRSLPPVMKVKEHPELKALPSRWEELEPIAESISLYFFPDNTRPNKDLDRLMKYVTNYSIVLKYNVGLANLLIFHSVFLPEKFQMFQGKHFLWGVFNCEKVRSKGDPPVKQEDCTSQVVKKRNDKQQKVQVDTPDQEKPVPLVKKQDRTSQFAKKRKQDRMQDDTLDQKKPVPSVKKQDCTSQVVNKRKNHHEKVQVDTLDQEKPVSKHNIPNDNQPLPDAVNDVNFAQTLSVVLTKPGNDGKAMLSSEIPAPMLSGLADAQRPRSRRDLRLNLKELIRLNPFALKPG